MEGEKDKDKKGRLQIGVACQSKQIKLTSPNFNRCHSDRPTTIKKVK